MAELTRPTRSLKGRVAIVTGAGALPGGIGNGRAAAVLLAEAGCSVVCVDLKPELAQHTVDMIEAEGLGAAIAVQGDVTSAEECKRIVDTTIQTYGRLHVLVNNVGILGPKGTAVEVDMGSFMKGLEVNVASMILMAKFCIPKMTANEGQWAGSIVNMSSVAGLRGGTPNILYPTSKGAIINMTRGMAANHAPDRIRVNCVCPGMVYTPMMYSGGSGMDDSERTARRERSLLKTEGNAWDVGAAIRVLAGDEARWITGVVLPVDAGTTSATGIGANNLYNSNAPQEANK
ncbi:Fc.00g080140.m01.CDS01 [Cosmosporella sp. VM-42]